MEEENYAVYREGSDVPCGTSRESLLEAIPEAEAAFGLRLRTEPITAKQAEQITRDITRCSEGVE